MALQCQHQNVVTFLGATLEGSPVILMEMMDASLRSAYEEERVKDYQINGILRDVAKALHFLHTRPDPVIHHDVSSANVLLKVLYNGEWLAKLGDLGTANLQHYIATPFPEAMAYGAPEAGDYTRHSAKMDVYSFGVVIIETPLKHRSNNNIHSMINWSPVVPNNIQVTDQLCMMFLYSWMGLLLPSIEYYSKV